MKHSRFALAALVFALGLYPTAASATYPGTNGLITFSQDRGDSGVEYIWVTNSDGSNRLALASGRDPHWTADGQRVYFSKGFSGIYSVRVNGTGLRKETWPASGVLDSQPYPLPSGGFVFTRWSATCCQSDVWVKLPGATAKRLTWTTGLQEFSPAVSPDGSRIAFIRSGSTGWSLYIMNRDGSQKRKLAPAAPDGGVDFSPDGSMLVFAQLLPNGSAGVYFYDLTSDAVSRVGSLESSEAGWGALSFSPDGTRLLINSSSDTGDLLFSTDLTGGDEHFIDVVPPDAPESMHYFGGGYWQPV